MKKSKMKKIIFVTTNKGKMWEATEVGKEFEVEFIQNTYDCPEIQSDSSEEIAVECAKESFKKIKKPLIVEDSGVFIDALKGFPGTYSAYVLKTIGIDGILKLMDGIKNRTATMESVLVYIDGKDIKTFFGSVTGDISNGKRGSEGFGYDPIFVPNGRTKTFGEDEAYKNKVSHRAQAIRAFCEWYTRTS